MSAWYGIGNEFNGQIANVLKDGAKLYEVHDTSESLIVISEDGQDWIETFEFDDDRIRATGEVLQYLIEQGFEVDYPTRLNLNSRTNIQTVLNHPQIKTIEHR